MAFLALGSLLWLGWGAVRHATHPQVSANGYLLSLVIVGAGIGLVAPGAALRTGAWLVTPGAIALVVAGPGGHPDWVWWWLTLAVGACAAGGSHAAVTLLRNRGWRLAGPRRGR